MPLGTVEVEDLLWRRPAPDFLIGSTAAHRNRQYPRVSGGGRLLRVLAMLVGVIGFSSCGLLDDPVTPELSDLEPLPDEFELVDAGTYPCRGSGDIGWQYQYAVIRGDEGREGGALQEALIDLGFTFQSVSDDWVTSVGRKDDVLLRLGPVANWRETPGSAIYGPLTAEVEEAMAGWTGPAALVGLEPRDVDCEV